MAFEEVLGQEGALAVIGRSLERGRVPHAYLFVGPESVGKRLAALGLARYLNCLSGGESPCKGCVSCLKMRRGNHPDVMVVERDGDYIRIEQIRELVRRAQLRPFEGRWKVFIINDAHAIYRDAFPSLLKTLEEPPGETVIILITHNLQAVPATIISRCQRVRFCELGEEALRKIVERERGKGAGDAALGISLARGRADLALSERAGEFLERREEALQILEGLSRSGRGEALGMVIPERPSRESARELLEWLLSLVRDLLALRNGAPEEALENGDLRERLAMKARGLGTEGLFSCFDAVRGSLEALRRNAHPGLTLDSLFLRLRWELQGEG